MNWWEYSSIHYPMSHRSWQVSWTSPNTERIVHPLMEIRTGKSSMRFRRMRNQSLSCDSLADRNDSKIAKFRRSYMYPERFSRAQLWHCGLDFYTTKRYRLFFDREQLRGRVGSREMCPHSFNPERQNSISQKQNKETNISVLEGCINMINEAYFVAW
jgi:hypothetical protein